MTPLAALFAAALAWAATLAAVRPFAALLAVTPEPPSLLVAALLAAFLAIVAAALHGVRTTRALRERAARVAHEVRGPLAAAHLALHGTARRGEIAPTAVAALELELRRAALALEDAALADPRDVDLHQLLTCQVRTWRDVAAAHGATLTLQPGIGTAVVHADALRVAQATSNVLANAIEHGGGTIAIRTALIGDRVRVEITDGGPGLPASVAELTRRPRAGHGTRGRGLAIAATVLAHCGGRIATLPSGPGVAIELPLAPETA
ncbi:MAG TPA: HAMP domain-containing sensor histidine kinase [Baekduia sp.]|nr:HAMP domain-containing sensor histidine kinase [Baekduia sp.]